MRGYLIVLSLVAISLAGVSLGAGCAWMQEPCACGRTFDDDPWTDEALTSVGPRHPVSIHCVCRCGDGPPVLEDPSARCDLYEGDCTTLEGSPATYTCD